VQRTTSTTTRSARRLSSRSSSASRACSESRRRLKPSRACERAAAAAATDHAANKLYYQCRRRGGGSRGNRPSSKLNFSPSENVNLVGKCSSKNTKFGAEDLPFGEEFTRIIEILSTRNLLSRKFAAVCPSALTHDAVVYYRLFIQQWSSARKNCGAGTHQVCSFSAMADHLPA